MVEFSAKSSNKVFPMTEDDVIENWTLLKEIINEIDVEVAKSIAGNSNANIRLRRGLYAIVKVARQSIKFSFNIQRIKREYSKLNKLKKETAL